MSIAEKLTTVAENVPKVYEAGKKTQYDEFWDAFQQSGSRKSYQLGFTGRCWNATSFKPKYNLQPTDSAYWMFAYFGYNGDLDDILRDFDGNRIELDFSKATNMENLFSSSSLSAVGVINHTSVTKVYNTFSWCGNLTTIKELIVNENNTFSGVFSGVTKLINLKVSGVIASNGFSVSGCTKLSKESITSIINALVKKEDAEGNAIPTGLTVTLSKTAVNNAFETTQGAADGRLSEEWAKLIATKPNWTISLV